MPPTTLSLLPLEVLFQTASYLPLPAICSLILSDPRSFHELHALITHTPSFAPWRGRYFRYQKIYERSWRALQDSAVDGRYKGTEEIITSGQVRLRTSLEQELEERSQELARDLGLIPGVGGAQENTGVAPVSISLPDPNRNPANAGRILLPRITIDMLFTALEHVSSPDVRHPRLPLLKCPLSAITDILCRNYAQIEWIQKFVPVPLQLQSSGSAAEAAATYKVFTAYLLFTSLTPNDIPRVLLDALFASGENTYSVDAVRGCQETALVEYFHFLRLFLLMHECDYRIRHGEPVDLRAKRNSFQATKILSGRLDVWIRGYFRPERPLPPPAAPANLTTEHVQGGRWRAPSMGTPSSSPTTVWKTSAVKPNYPYQKPSPITHQSSTEFILTQEQKKVVDTDVRAGELMKVRAYAGTGKTMSLVEYAKKRPSTKFLYLSFNKSAATYAEKRFPPNVVCKTMHSIAYSTIGACAPIIKDALFNNSSSRRRDRHMEISGSLSANQIIEMLSGLDYVKINSLLVNPQAHMKPGSRQKQEGKKRFPTQKAVAAVIKRTLSKYWSSKDIQVGRRCLPHSVVEMLGLKGDVLVKWAREIWEAMRTATAKYLPHDAYLKILHLDGIGQGTGVGGNASAAVAMGRGRGDRAAFTGYDIIMWDEAQDSNPSMAEIVFRQRPWVGLIVVGDPYQNIYGFRGANNEFSDDEAHKPTYSCYLTHSFRFGDAIAGVANVLLRSLRENVGVNGVRKHDSVKASLPQALEMRGSKEVQVLKRGAVENGGSGKYTVIFRKNITLVKYAFEYCMSHSHLGHQVILRTAMGFDKKSLFGLLRDGHALYNGTPCKNGVLAGYKTWEDLREHVDAETSDEGTTDPPSLGLIMGLEELIALSDFSNTLECCEIMVLGDRHGEAEGDVILTTCHQAKGLEWDRVVVAGDFNPQYSCRESLGKSKHLREEMFMTYVAVTRAKKELILGEGVAAWLAAEMGMYRFYVSPTQGMGKCPTCSGKPPTDESNEDEPKREGVVMGYECVLPAGSFGAMITEPEAKHRRPFGSRKDVLVCHLCACDSFHVDSTGTDTELKDLTFLTIRALMSKSEIAQLTPNEAGVLDLSERSTLSAVYRAVYKHETEMINSWVKGRSTPNVVAAALVEDLMDVDEEEDDEEDSESDQYGSMILD